jgi:hypothetical protein
MKSPSPEWTVIERLTIIAVIAAKIEESARQQMFVMSSLFFDRANTIRMVATQSTGFLETNRAQILKDAGVTDEKIDVLLEKLSDIGDDYCHAEYGLPVYKPEWLIKMRTAAREWLAKDTASHIQREKWTTEKPKDRGWYWIRNAAIALPDGSRKIVEPTVVEIFSRYNGGLCFFVGTDGVDLGEVLAAEWAGPIPLPEELK